MNSLYLKIFTVLPLLHRSEVTIRIPVKVRCVVHSYVDKVGKTYNRLFFLKFVNSCYNGSHSVELFFVWSRSIRLYFDFFISYRDRRNRLRDYRDRRNRLRDYRDRMNRLRDFLHVMSVLNPSLVASFAKIDIAFPAVESGFFNIL